jgi:hypothetical protein
VSDSPKHIDEIWAEEGGMRLRIEAGENGRIAFSIVDVTVGWPGAVMAKATLAEFRVKRMIEGIRKSNGETCP